MLSLLLVCFLAAGSALQQVRSRAAGPLVPAGRVVRPRGPAPRAGRRGRVYGRGRSGGTVGGAFLTRICQNRRMRITEAARRLGTSPRMLRYRETLGLLPATRDPAPAGTGTGAGTGRNG